MMAWRVDVSKGKQAYSHSPGVVTMSATWSRNTYRLRAKLPLLFVVLLCTFAFVAATLFYNGYAWTHSTSPAYDLHDVAHKNAVTINCEPRDKCSGSTEQESGLVNFASTTVGGWHDAARANGASFLLSSTIGGSDAWAAMVRLVYTMTTTVMTTRVFATTLKSRLSSEGYFDSNGNVTPAGKTVADV
jgi:hypothetical protein